jgi:hypothetical protein
MTEFMDGWMEWDGWMGGWLGGLVDIGYLVIMSNHDTQHQHKHRLVLLYLICVFLFDMIFQLSLPQGRSMANFRGHDRPMITTVHSSAMWIP